MDRDEIKIELNRMSLGELLSLLEDVFESQINDMWDGDPVLREHRQISNATKAVAILALLKA